MNKQSVVLSLSFVVALGLASQAGGCLSSTTPATSPDAANTGGGSGSSGGSSSGAGSGSGGGGSGACTVADPTTIIDDMSGANGTQNATGGYWYTYSDRTVPNSEPPILLMGAMPPPGSITPPEGKSFPITDASMINGCSWSYREAIGGGNAKWGAGFGMDFLSYPPDGGQVAFNQCDAGQIFNVNDFDSGTVGIVQPYDASKWTGISFWAISFTGKSQAVYVQMDDDDTSPWGGKCNACNSTGGTVMPCSDSFRKSVTFTSAWTQIQIPFADPLLKPQDWSKNGIKAPIHSGAVYNLHFQITAAPTPPFDLGVAMVQFYK